MFVMDKFFSYIFFLVNFGHPVVCIEQLTFYYKHEFDRSRQCQQTPSPGVVTGNIEKK